MKRNQTKPRRSLRPRTRSTVTGTLFFLPWLIGFFAITAYPLVYSLVICFNQVQIKPGEIILEPVGWEYFRQAFAVDTEYPTKLLSSLASVLLGTPLVVVFSLVIALLLNRKFRGRTVYRIVFFLPVVIMSGPVMSELMTESSAMSINMDIMGLRSILMELDYGWARILLTFLNSFVRILWFCGVQIIVFLAGLQKVDRNMYEAAAIDGATAWEAFWKITLPHLRPIILLNAIYTIIEMGTTTRRTARSSVRSATLPGRTAMRRCFRGSMPSVCCCSFCLPSCCSGRERGVPHENRKIRVAQERILARRQPRQG